MLLTPSFWQACFQVRLFEESPLTWIRPPTASRSSGLAPKLGATVASSWSRASTQPRRVDALTPPTVVLPPEAPEAGYLLDRKSTRLNSSHANISYAVF